MSQNLIVALNTISEIGVEIANLTKDAKKYRERVVELLTAEGLGPVTDEAPVEFIQLRPEGSRVWSVSRAKGSKDINVTYRDLPTLKNTPNGHAG